MDTRSDSKTFEELALEHDIKQYSRTNTILLCIHIVLTVPYYVFSPRYMLIINLFSILFYIYGFKCIKKGRKSISNYSYMILAEILIHDIFCVLVFGWECGFELWILSLVGTYIKDYIEPDKPEKQKNLYAAVVVAIGLITFLSLYFITKYTDLPMHTPLKDDVVTFLMILNTCITFLAMIAFTNIYTRQMEFKFTELHNQADYDQLTKLGNRYYMNDLLESEEKVSKEDAGYCVAMIDIDHFKTVNDTYGHQSGDMVLTELAKLLSNDLPNNIKVGRWGGEEFLIISNHTVSYNDFLVILQDLRQKVEANLFSIENGEKIRCTISIGCAKFHEGYSVQEVIKKADTKLYIAKNSGRNRLIAE